MYKYELGDIDEFVEKYGPEKNPEVFAMFQSIGAYFHGIGVLVKRELIDVDLVYDLMPRLVFRLWDKLEPLIKESANRDALAFKHLYKELKKRQKQLASTTN